MRHGKKVNHLSRQAPHRKAMLANMACSLIEHKRINTTVAKAKALKVFVEPLITKSKSDDTHNRRIVFSYLRNKYAVAELFRTVADKVGDRPGGYTRIIKTGNRLGDNAEMCLIELVDFNDTYNNAKEAKKPSTRRSRRGGKSSAKSTSTEKAPKAEGSKTEAKPKAATSAAEEAKADKVKAEEQTEPKVKATKAKAAATDKDTSATMKEAKAETPKKEPASKKPATDKKDSSEKEE